MVSTTTWLQPREYKSPYYAYRCLSVLIEQFRNSRHDIPVSYPTMHHWEQRCAHFCSQWCIVGYGTGALWDLQISCLSSALCKVTVKESRPGATQCNERYRQLPNGRHFPKTQPVYMASSAGFQQPAFNRTVLNWARKQSTEDFLTYINIIIH